MSLSQQDIATIRSRTDLIALVGDHVRLNKRGRNHMGLCPFHQERSPSFSVNADKGLFYCFGCHKGGDAFAFVMAILGMSFQQAATHLAQKAGLNVALPTPQQQAQTRAQLEIVAINTAAHKHLVAELFGRNGQHAQRYLAKRHVPAALAKSMHLGLMPSGTDLIDKLVQNGFQKSQLIKAGLIGENAQWPSLAGRLTFAIHDLAGGLIGFGGRRLGTQGPKYLNSKETLAFKKSEVLFGLYAGQKAIRAQGYAVVVEGFFDVLAMHHACMPQAVAALGTAITKEHAALLKRLCPKVILMLDQDRAGQEAAIKAAETLMRYGLNVWVGALPQGEDPASVVQRHGPKMLQNAIQEARPALDHFLAVHPGCQATSDIEGRVASIGALMPLVDHLQTGLERELWASRLASKLALTEEQLNKHWHSERAKRRQRALDPSTRRNAAASGTTPSASAGGAALAQVPKASAALAKEYQLIRDVLLFPCVWRNMNEIAELLDETAAKELVLALQDMPPTDAAQYTALIQKHVVDANWCRRLLKCAPFAEQAVDVGDLRANRTFSDLVRALQRRRLDNALRQVLRALGEAEVRGDATDSLLRRKQVLAAQKRALLHAANSGDGSESDAHKTGMPHS